MATQDKNIFELLAEPFPAACVEWLPKKIMPPRDPDRNGRGVGRALALCYIDARSVMARLDEVVGPGGWQDSYRSEGGRTVCRLALKIGDEWVAKEDGSGDSDIEAEKGGISGAFKRAAVKWGIGRYLYDVDEVWADCNVTVRRGDGRGKDKVYHNGWTRDGEADLADALNRAPGPRETGRPMGVDNVLEQIEQAETYVDLKALHTKHWAAIPLEYRAEVLRALDSRKEELERMERDGRSSGPDDDRYDDDHHEEGDEG